MSRRGVVGVSASIHVQGGVESCHVHRGMCVHTGGITCVYRGPWCVDDLCRAHRACRGLGAGAGCRHHTVHTQHHSHLAVNVETKAHMESTLGMFLRSWMFMENASVSLTQTFRERWTQCVRREGWGAVRFNGQGQGQAPDWSQHMYSGSLLGAFRKKSFFFVHLPASFGNPCSSFSAQRKPPSSPVPKLSKGVRDLDGPGSR